MHIQTADKTARIRELHDQARRTFLGCAVMLMSAIHELSVPVRARLLCRLRDFDEFDEGNDPHGEHDFGAIKPDGDTYFFKFDYYDKSMEYGSEDPSDPRVTQRVLTLMHRSEY